MHVFFLDLNILDDINFKTIAIPLTIKAKEYTNDRREYRDEIYNLGMMEKYVGTVANILG